jgi:hypothetical protein
MTLDTYRCAEVSALILKALAIPEVKKKLHSRSLAGAVKCFLDSDSLEGPFAAVSVLAQSMQAGFGFARELIEAVYSVGIDADIRPENDGDLFYLQNIVTRPSRRERREAAMSASPREAIPLRGGIGFGIWTGVSDYHSSLADVLARINAAEENSTSFDSHSVSSAAVRHDPGKTA